MAYTRRDDDDCVGNDAIVGVPAYHLDGNIKMGVFGNQSSFSRTVVLELALGVLDAAVLELAPSVLDAVSISSSAVLVLARGALDTDCRFPPFPELASSVFKMLPAFCPFINPIFSSFFIRFPSTLAIRLNSKQPKWYQHSVVKPTI